MAATGRTQNYGLPIFTATDGTTWEAYNRAMNLIDTALANLEGSQGGDVTQEDLEKLKEQLDQAIGVIAVELVGKDKELQTQITNLGTVVDGHTGDITTLKADVAEVQTDVRKAQADIAAGDTKDVDLQEQITAQGQFVLENRAKVGELQTQIDKLGTTVDGHTTEIGNLKTAIDQIEGAGDVTELAATVAGHTTQIAAIDTQVKKNSGSIGVLDAQMNAANREISLQSGSIGSLNTSVMTLTDTAQNLEKNVQTLSERIDDANDYMNDVLTPDVDNVKKSISALDGDLSDLQTSVAGVQSELADRTQDITELEAASRTQGTDITTLKAFRTLFGANKANLFLNFSSYGSSVIKSAIMSGHVLVPTVRSVGNGLYSTITGNNQRSDLLYAPHFRMHIELKPQESFAITADTNYSIQFNFDEQFGSYYSEIPYSGAMIIGGNYIPCVLRVNGILGWCYFRTWSASPLSSGYTIVIYIN